MSFSIKPWGGIPVKWNSLGFILKSKDYKYIYPSLSENHIGGRHEYVIANMLSALDELDDAKDDIFELQMVMLNTDVITVDFAVITSISEIMGGIRVVMEEH